MFASAWIFAADIYYLICDFGASCSANCAPPRLACPFDIWRISQDSFIPPGCDDQDDESDRTSDFVESLCYR